MAGRAPVPDSSAGLRAPENAAEVTP
jgi:hypothetical protein